MRNIAKQTTLAYWLAFFVLIAGCLQVAVLWPSLKAVGFRPQQLRAMVFSEHRWLIAAALSIGTAGALVAVWPNLSQKAAGFPLREMALLLASLVIGCVFWTWVATRLALRGSAVPALRAE